jgi:hypothetical protein
MLFLLAAFLFCFCMLFSWFLCLPDLLRTLSWMFKFVRFFFIDNLYRGRWSLSWTNEAYRTRKILSPTDLLRCSSFRRFYWLGLLFFTRRRLWLFFNNIECWRGCVDFWLDFRARLWIFPFCFQKVHHWASNLAQRHPWPRIGRRQLRGFSLLTHLLLLLKHLNPLPFDFLFGLVPV